MNLRVVTNATLVTTAIFYGAVAAVAANLPLIGVLTQFLVIFSLCRYAYEVLRAFAQGRRDVPAPDFDTVNPFGRWSYLLHFVAFIGAVACAQIYLGAGWIAGVIAAAVFPASAALMVLTGRLEAALNPAAVSAAVRLLGRDYLWLTAAVLVAVAGAAFVSIELSAHSTIPAIGALLVLDAWALLAVFALTGSAVHAHRLDFDIPGLRPDPGERARTERERTWQAVLDRAYASLRSGEPEAGYRALRQFLAEHDHSPEAYYWLVEHLFDWEDKRHALGVAARLIETEIAQGRASSAFELYSRCRRLGGVELAPSDAGTLARYAASIGQHGAASELSERAGPAAPGV